MANVFDIGLLNEFRIIFGWLFVFVVVYAILEVTKVLGENKGLHGIFAVAVATLFAIQPNAVAIVTGSAPWFVLMIVIFMFMMLISRFAFGDKGDEILMNLFGNERGAGWWIFVPIIIIIGMMIASTVGPGITPGSGEEGVDEVDVNDPDYVPGEGSTATPDYETNVVNTLFHPKVLGMIVLLIIALFTVLTITGVPKK